MNNQLHHLSGKLFPIGLIVLLLGLSLWLNQVSSLSTKGAQLDPKKPKYTIDYVTGRRFDKTGNLQEQLVATKTWQKPLSDIVYTIDPVYDLFETGVRKYHLEGKTAEYDSKMKTIYFDNNVLMVRPASDKQSEAIIQTSKLTANTIEQTVSSKEKITFTYGESHGSSVGFSYNHKTSVLNLNSRVSATYEVPQKP